MSWAATKSAHITLWLQVSDCHALPQSKDPRIETTLKLTLSQ